MAMTSLHRSQTWHGPDPSSPLLEISDLSIRFALADRDVFAVNGIDLRINPGEVFALVGESGSGKSVSALSIMGLLSTPPAVVSGSIRLDGQELTSLNRKAIRKIRGREIGMVFQDPMSSLNPVHPVGRQIGESLRLHFGVSRKVAKARAIEMLDRVGIPDAARRAGDFPHEFSGGMQQRAIIAMALACDPKLLIADEPTTALDVTVQSQIVALVRDLQQERGMAVLWITHDLGVVAEIADRVAVMYAGRIMEEGTVSEIYANTRHPYTAGLLRSIPRLDRPVSSRLAEIPGTPAAVSEMLTACPFHERCSLAESACLDGLPDLEATDRQNHSSACIHQATLADGDESWAQKAASEAREDVHDTVERPEAIVRIEGLEVHFPIHRGRLGIRRSVIRAVDGVDLVVEKGRTLGIVGESGCGKTTLGRTLVGLITPTSGSVRVNGKLIDTRRGDHRRVIQMIFQDPFSSMNPGMRVRDVIAEPLKVHRICPSESIDERVAELLAHVGLPADTAHRHPHEFSGGQRQRIAVARALAVEPEVIVCDEPVSALDVSVQAQIVNLLVDIQKRDGLSLLFIAHDLAVIRHISHDVAVMYLGQIVERATRDDLFENPLHPYTKALLAAIPVPDPAVVREDKPLTGDLPSPSDPPDGCRFHTRCPMAVENLCDVEVPELREVASGQWVACHLVGNDESHDLGSSGATIWNVADGRQQVRKET